MKAELSDELRYPMWNLDVSRSICESGQLTR
jgi:hypothetical protein